ncbi:hypothetical protein IWQ61_008741, partial [Dispira simplex]
MQLLPGTVGIAVWALGWQALWLLAAHGCNPDTEAPQQLPRRAFETPLVGRAVHFPDISRRNNAPVGISPVRRNSALNEPRDPIATDSFLTNSGSPNNNAVPGVLDTGDDADNDNNSNDEESGDGLGDINDQESADGSDDNNDEGESTEPSGNDDDAELDTAVPLDQTSQIVERRDDVLGLGLDGDLTGRKPCPCG